MSIGRSLGLLAVAVVCIGSCRGTPRARAEQLRALEIKREQRLESRIAAADAGQAKDAPLAMWFMPPELREISGLSLLSNGHVLTHDDELAVVYEIDPKTGIILKHFELAGKPHGDFEAITTAGTDIYLLESKGVLFVFKDGPDAGEVPFTRFDTKLGHECEFESLAYEADSSRLLMVCKNVKTKALKGQLVIYHLPLPLTDTTNMSVMTVAMTDVIGTNDWKKFQPSDMAIDPTTRNYVLIGSLEKGLVEITPGGDVVRSEPLPKGHNQAEGVAVTPDGILIVSDEATHKPAAMTLYRWRP